MKNSNNFLILIFSMFILGVSCDTKALQKLEPGTNTKRPIGTHNNEKGYWEYLPRLYSENGTSMPLLIFMHGLGENGSGSAQDLEKINSYGPPMLIKNGNWPGSRPFVVLSPQQQSSCPTAIEVKNFINFALNKYNVDPKRIYLTGLSCGGYGISAYLSAFGAEQVAAVVPISGDASSVWANQGCGLLNAVAIWSFHGDLDGSPYIGDTTAMTNFRNCPGSHKEALYTVYNGVGHDAWTMTYDLSAGHDIYSWMLKFSR